MKCKRCGYVGRTIGGMAAHYRKKHPALMKSRAKRGGSRRERGGAVRFTITGGSLTGTLH